MIHASLEVPARLLGEVVMVRIAILITLVLASWHSVGKLQAALFLPAEPPQATLGTDPRLFGDWLKDWRSLPRPAQGEYPEQQRFRDRLAILESRHANGGLTPVDRVNLSGYHLRLGDPLTPAGKSHFQKAIRVLEEVPSTDRDFMVLANLATAYQLLGTGLTGRELYSVLQRAQGYLEQAMAVWPASSPYYSTRLLSWYLRVEQFELKLIQKRALEALQSDRQADKPARKGDGRFDVPVDALFPGVPCTGARGEYRLGPLPPREALQIPDDAYSIVGQLVLWLPMDDRLFWLLGEVANAQEGSHALAFKILHELQWARNYSPQSLIDHRKELYRATIVGDALIGELRADRLVRFSGLTANQSLSPLHGMLPPGVAPLLTAVGTTLAVDEVVQKPPPARESSPEPGPEPLPEKTVIDWKQLGIGFLCGAILTVLGIMQIRQIQRRKRLATMEIESNRPA